MKRILSILLALILVLSAVTFSAFAEDTVMDGNTSAVADGDNDTIPQSPDGDSSLSQREPSDDLAASGAEEDLSASGAEPTFDYEVNTSGDLNTLKAYLEMNANIKINILSDMSARIGKKGDADAPYIDYWCTLGTGVKVINLNGHKLELANDGNHYQNRHMWMFRIPAGAELVVNDSTDSGEIHYEGYIRDYSEELNNIEQRHLIAIDGGKLTFNGGKLITGRSKKVYNGWMAISEYKQINGCAVTLRSGEAVFHGGEIQGRGFKNMSKDRDAAIDATGGKITIYDGAFWGMGCADTLHIGEDVDIKIYSGIFDVHKQDYGINLDSFANLGFSSSYGTIGIPGRESSRTLYSADYYYAGKLMKAEDRLASGADQVSRRISVHPAKSITSLKYETADTSARTEYEDRTLTFEWDKQSRLAFGVASVPYYPQVRSFDQIVDHTFPENTVTISTSENGNGVSNELTNVCLGSNSKLDPSGWFDESEMIDLSQIPAAALDQLQVGSTYYVQLTGHERWINHYEFDRVLKPRATIKIKIVERDDEIPDFGVSFNWQNHPYDELQSTDLMLIPYKNTLNNYVQSGAIDKYQAQFVFSAADGSRKTKQYGFNELYDTYTYHDGLHGANYVQFFVDIYKNNQFITQKSASATAILFPYITSSVAPDDSNRILIEPTATNKTVTLYSGANNTSGLFWAKDGVKISGSTGKSSYPVNLSSSAAVGWYTLGYTVNGTDHLSDQSYYLGVKDGTREVDLTVSSGISTITGNGCTTPTLTAAVSGTGWGTITQYKWKNVKWPEGTSPSALMTSTSTNTINMAKLFGAQGHEAEYLIEGKYAFSVTAIDAYGNKATSHSVVVKVNRPVTGIKLYSDYSGVPGHEHEDLTGGFFVIGDEGTAGFKVYGERQPVNATAGEITYSSANESVARIDEYGYVIGLKAGFSRITAHCGAYSALAKAIVSKIKYNITIPDSWLTVEAGAQVHRGAISVPDNSGFTAELRWYCMDIGNENEYEYTKDTFEWNKNYIPMLTVYPKAGVYYPVDLSDGYAGIYHTVNKDRFEITVNGETYYEADYCGRKDFFENEPVSAGDHSKDYFERYLHSTPLINPNNEYIDCVVFNLEEPVAGEPKDVTPENISNLYCSVQTSGVSFGGDGVYHITDTDTIKDNDYTNDAKEDFTAYEAGETYRYSVWLVLNSNYTNNEGGRAFFSPYGPVTAVDPEHKTLVNNSTTEYNYIVAYCYFTVSEAEQTPTAGVSGTVTSYLSDTNTISLSLIPEGETEAAYTAYAHGNNTTYSFPTVPQGKYTLRVSKLNHGIRDYKITVSGALTQNVTINPIGDVNLNGKVDIKDVNALYKHAKESEKITDPYALVCANVNGDESVNIKDVNRLYKHVMEASLLY